MSLAAGSRPGRCEFSPRADSVLFRWPSPSPRMLRLPDRLPPFRPEGGDAWILEGFEWPGRPTAAFSS